MPKPLKIEWSDDAKSDLKAIYSNLEYVYSRDTARRTRLEIVSAPESIIFPEQYQFDEYIIDCGRIIIRHYKILYRFQNEIISIVSVFDSRNNPLKMSS